MDKLRAFARLGTCLLLVMGPLGHMADDNNQELDSERELKRMLTFVRPLMGIIRSDTRIRRSTDMLSLEWTGRAAAAPKRPRNGYGGGYGGGGGYQSCCDDGHDYLGLISLISLGLLFLFLITLLSTTTATGRKKRSEEDDLMTLEEILSKQDIGNVHMLVVEP